MHWLSRSEAIREAFCEVYEQDVLTNFAKEMRDMLSPKNLKKFPNIPERGNLDLSLVNDQYLEELSMKNSLSGLVVHDIENGRHCVYKSKEYLLRCKNNHLPSLLFYKYLQSL